MTAALQNAGKPMHTPCPIYRKCSGCQLQNLSYPEQLAWKQRRCQALLGSFAKIRPILGMDNPYHYRHKVQAAFALDRQKRVISGIYQASRRCVIPVTNCQTEDKKADEIIAFIRNHAKRLKLVPYDNYRQTGCLRHVLVKHGFATGEIMVVFVTAAAIFAAKKFVVEALLKAFPQITTIVQNISPGNTPMMLGEQEKILYGSGYITDRLCGFSFRISARSFYQINPKQTETLYRTAIDLAELGNNETALDAYCGTGTIGIIAAPQLKFVTGIELNRDAVRDAIANAKMNGVKNIYFHCADAGDFMEEIVAGGEESLNVLFMDPPRAGATISFLTAALKARPQKIVYISCNPESLARDLRLLTEKAYQVKAIQPVDMFPHTNHIETIVSLQLK